jgi:hypothetical protein
VWYIVSLGLRGMYSHVFQAAVVGRELLCKNMSFLVVNLLGGVACNFTVSRREDVNYLFRIG